MDVIRTAPSRPAPADPAPAGPVQRILAQADGALRDAAPRHGYQRVVYLAGVLLVVSGLVHVVVLAVDGGGWDGPLSWRKAILFGVSFGMSTVAAGWVLGTLPHSRLWGRTAAGMLVGGGVAEVALITAQTWRGTESHFNVLGDPVDALVFTLMAVAVGVYTLGLVVLTVWAAARLRRPAPTVVAVLVGLALTLVGSALGGDLIGRGLAHVDEYETIPATVVIGAAGSGRLAHAVALHGLQVLGVLALLLGRSALPAAGRTRTMAVAAGAYVALTAGVAAQAYAGRSMLELSWPAAAGIGLAALTVVAALGWSVKDAVLGARRAA
ncbi:hypothetical protein [Cellulomonas sp. S1-8]|uniref:hypothetical protein n=1 Tax=Cellulomonas sp. S1-8 TaxID=2904790 RepID=UPI00224427C6|nr:hypothetical protein [Cellulomonas sp. S1-8]UZN03702.1 hypothetical protein OKX07_01790 [Cellulomonas sp. S1-8]